MRELATGAPTVLRIERLFEMLKRFREELSTSEESVLLQRTCRIAVEHGGFRFAWIGRVDQARQVIVPAGHAGFGADYLEGIEIGLSDTPNGRGPTGTAAREGRAIVCSDVTSDPNLAQWRARYVSFGFRSSGAFPIRRNGAVYATLNLYADAPGFIETLERTMMEELAVRLGMALDEIDREAAKRAIQAQLVSSEARYRSIVEHAADGVLLFDPDRRVLEANPAACRMLAYPRDELVGMTVDDLNAPEKRELYTDGIARFRQMPTGATASFSRVAVTKDGRRLDLEIHATRLTLGDSLVVVRDVTERKRIEAQHAGVERLVSLGRLAQSVGHEINNPLSYLTLQLGRARTLVERFPSELRHELDEALAFAGDGAARIAHVARSLSAVGRGDREALEPIAVESVVGAAVSLVNNRLQHLGAVKLELAATPPVLANPFGLTQVLVNLLLNAADAIENVSREHHAVTISSRVEGERVIVEVSDTGPGIPPADLPHLFDVGFTTKAVGKGSGIGLAVSRAIIASLGGSLDAGNQPSGGGAVFRIGLSTTNGAPAERRLPVPQRESPPQRILIIDDEPRFAKTLALLLADHHVEVCTTISAAFDACMRADFDLILCDVMMPNGGGMALYERLGRDRADLVSKVVFVTGGTFTEAGTRFLERVPNRRILKPFSHEELLAIIESPG